MKHMPIGAVSSGPMTTSRARSDRIRQPSVCAQKRARAGQIVGIHDDVMQPHGHAVSVLDAVAHWLRTSRCGPLGRCAISTRCRSQPERTIPRRSLWWDRIANISLTRHVVAPPERSCAKENSHHDREASSQDPRGYRPQRSRRARAGVRPRAAALDDGKALGTGWLDLKCRTWVRLPDRAIPIAARPRRRCSPPRAPTRRNRKAS